MAFMDWSVQYELGIESINEEHRKLVEYINTLYDAMKQGKGSLVVEGILESLSGYCVEHFKHEEGLFDRHGYEGAAEHKREHSAFVAKVTAFKADFAAKKVGLTIEVMDFLMDWLKSHIMGSDKAYAPFLISKGAQ